jgi:hypothetical protein
MTGVNTEGKGWREIGISSGAHLQRMVQMYEELGFEVHLTDVESGDQQCLTCYENRSETPYKLYVTSRDEAGR